MADAKTRKTTFSMRDKLRALEGVIGHQRPGKFFVQNEQAKYLGLDSAQWSRKLNEATASGAELAGLIEWFGLAGRVDFRLFEAPNRDDFLAVLQRAGIGTYGGSFRSQLCAHFFARSVAGEEQEHKCSIKISKVTASGHRGGIGRDPGPNRPSAQISLMQGDQVKFALKGPAGCHVVLLTTTERDELEVLSPTQADPQQVSSVGVVDLPDENNEPFRVKNAGYHRIYAIWTDAPTASIFLDIARRNDGQILDPDANLLLGRFGTPGVVQNIASLTYQVYEQGRG